MWAPQEETAAPFVRLLALLVRRNQAIIGGEPLAGRGQGPPVGGIRGLAHATAFVCGL